MPANRGHNAPPDHKFKDLHHRPEAPRHAADQARVQTAGRHRALIGHLKEHHRIGRYLAHASGTINAVLAAAGYNFRRLLAWLRVLLLSILIALGLTAQLKST